MISSKLILCIFASFSATIIKNSFVQTTELEGVQHVNETYLSEELFIESQKIQRLLRRLKKKHELLLFKSAAYGMRSFQQANALLDDIRQFIMSKSKKFLPKKLICMLDFEKGRNHFDLRSDFYLNHFDPNLCTHIIQNGARFQFEGQEMLLNESTIPPTPNHHKSVQLLLGLFISNKDLESYNKSSLTNLSKSINNILLKTKYEGIFLYHISLNQLSAVDEIHYLTKGNSAQLIDLIKTMKAALVSEDFSLSLGTTHRRHDWKLLLELKSYLKFYMFFPILNLSYREMFVDLQDIQTFFMLLEMEAILDQSIIAIPVTGIMHVLPINASGEVLQEVSLEKICEIRKKFPNESSDWLYHWDQGRESEEMRNGNLSIEFIGNVLLERLAKFIVTKQLGGLALFEHVIDARLMGNKFIHSKETEAQEKIRSRCKELRNFLAMHHSASFYLQN